MADDLDLDTDSTNALLYNPSRFLGRRYRELAKNWIPTVGVRGATGAVGLVWATGWQLILDWVPYNNGKFKKDN
ncbi:PREDICTED: cytochrome b-c1 complex subunit 10-like [Lipotes vexillifer]|uniref:Cytochrome b-c1 complex subunit 10 n=1 Tax=Lipotes vexillifer TaxID=118797 RepID=A0A340WNG7_LIPVE|nr:PREDICTED: cytochrome b-c1 complex subunit 10-like [Lipotes vexillifer]